jgi:hypothetical protein
MQQQNAAAVAYLIKGEEAMATCEHCKSNSVKWFTPPTNVDRAAVLLCMSCRHLTIVPPHQHRFETAHRPVKAA